MTTDSVDRALELGRAIDKVQWAVAGDVAHPTATCRPTGLVPPSRRCVCGLWEALDLVRASRFGRLIRTDGYPL